jgi:hypothetical protein
MIASFMSWFPHWYIAACFMTGFVVLPVLTLLASRPLLRGLSYGLYETVVFYKCGVSMWRVIKRLIKAVLWNTFTWQLLNPGLQNTANNESSWSGIFRWSFRKTFTRAAGKKWNAEQAAAKRKAAMDADI